MDNREFIPGHRHSENGIDSITEDAGEHLVHLYLDRPITHSNSSNHANKSLVKFIFHSVWLDPRLLLNMSFTWETMTNQNLN